MKELTPSEADEFIENSNFLWHQRFELSPGIFTPGVNDIDWLLANSSLPTDMRGLSVLDIGTTNGATAFECERRGAGRIVAVDILPETHFGIRQLCDLLDSEVTFVQSSVYGLAEELQETFDVVIFWGVLYHLRHPLLGLDAVRRVSKGHVSLETAVSDWIDGSPGPLARFHRLDDLGDDPTNWWSPTVAALTDWVASAGFTVTSQVAIPADVAPRTRSDGYAGRRWNPRVPSRVVRAARCCSNHSTWTDESESYRQASSLTLSRSDRPKWSVRHHHVARHLEDRPVLADECPDLGRSQFLTGGPGDDRHANSLTPQAIRRCERNGPRSRSSAEG